MRRTMVVLGLAVGLAVSCSASPQGSTPASSGGATVDASSSIPPSGPPGATGVLHDGRARLTLTGDLDASVELTSLSGLVTYAPAPGGFTIGWSGQQTGSTLMIAGQTFTGERNTSAALTLSFQTSIDGTHVFASSNGECTIDVATAEPTTLAGGFSCEGLTSVDGADAVDVEGTFEATG